MQKSNSIEWRFTPWDKKAFNLETVEIISVPDTCDNFQKNIMEVIESSGADLVYGRFTTSNRVIKKSFQQLGFSIAETAATVFCPNLQNNKLGGVLSRKKLKIESGTPSERDEIKKITSDMYDFSRFHEDVLVENSKANLRMVNWIDDLIDSGKSFFILRNGDGEVIAYMFYEVVGLNINLILGGSERGSRMISPFFWYAVMAELKMLGYKKVSTLVSIANVGVISLYQELGFRILETFSDYHWHKRGL